MVNPESFFLSQHLKLQLPLNGQLGQGGQGTVYLVQTPQGPKAVKWYNLQQANAEQRRMIQTLVQQGPPQGEGGYRFVWPLDMVSHPSSATQFGYMMDVIDRERFIALGEMWAGQKHAPSFYHLMETSWQVANSYYALHMSGYCYRDISTGNVLFDPQSGEVRICDNDNVCIDQQTPSQIWGTLEFMAPELILAQVKPSTDTDLHALAVWLFFLWVWHHPLHGLLEYQIRSWDLPARRYIYGSNPVFVFDPDNFLNRLPDDPDYETAAWRWRLCPPALQQHFIQAFTVGLHDPTQRVTESQWQRLFRQLQDQILVCPHDQAENIWAPGQPSLHCWYCQTSLQVPPQLVIELPQGPIRALLTRDFRLLPRHVIPFHAQRSVAPLGDVIHHPHDPHLWGLRNLSPEPWQMTDPEGNCYQVSPQKSVPLRQGTRITIRGQTVSIQASS